MAIKCKDLSLSPSFQEPKQESSQKPSETKVKPKTDNLGKAHQKKRCWLKKIQKRPVRRFVNCTLLVSLIACFLGGVLGRKKGHIMFGYLFCIATVIHLVQNERTLLR